MDPHANLKRQRELAAEIVEQDDMNLPDDSPADEARTENVYQAAVELAELVQQHLHYIAGIFELMSLVRHHSDYVFGTIFVTEDFPDGVVPDDFNGRVIEDLLTERGNEYIADHCGTD